MGGNYYGNAIFDTVNLDLNSNDFLEYSHLSLAARNHQASMTASSVVPEEEQLSPDLSLFISNMTKVNFNRKK